MTLRVATLLLGLGLAGAAQAQPTRGWNEEKCARYSRYATEALALFGRDGLSAAFLARHQAFLASGCRTREAVCPRSAQELALADALTIAAMNGGMASSFVPFRCPG